MAPEPNTMSGFDVSAPPTALLIAVINQVVNHLLAYRLSLRGASTVRVGHSSQDKPSPVCVPGTFPALYSMKEEITD